MSPLHAAHAKKDKRGQDEATQQGGQQQGVSISRDQAAAIARSATGGQVLSVDLRGSAYRVKVLLDGKRVRTVGVDARSGAVSN
jgi:uncharacterized membrane protein YkoI